MLAHKKDWWRLHTYVALALFTSLLWIASALPDVDNLEGEADFRSVTLHWKYGRLVPTKYGFLITYCEDQAWGNHRCKKREISDLAVNEIDGSDSLHREFAAEITGLRMATNYTMEVSPILARKVSEERSDRGRSMGSHIKIRTRGFSARAITCLANYSIVEVDTGPTFGGKISVEHSTDPHCTTKGNKTSDQTIYMLTIDHDLCGSDIQNSSVRTFIVVQENLPILTHSTKRFMVVCNYIPETFTVRAGVNLPEYGDNENERIPIDKSIGEVDPSELFDSTNFLDSSIASEVGRALKLSAQAKDKKPQMWAHLVLMVILVMAAVVGISCAIWQIVRHNRNQNRSGFMSPQDEPSAVEVDGNLEAVVRDFGPEVEVPFQVETSFVPDINNLTTSDDLINLQIIDEDNLQETDFNDNDIVDDLQTDDGLYYEDCNMDCLASTNDALSAQLAADFANLAVSHHIYDPVCHLESLGPGTSVDPDIYSMSTQVPLTSQFHFDSTFSSISNDHVDQIHYIDLVQDSCSHLPDVYMPSHDVVDIEFQNPTLTEMPSGLLNYDNRSTLILSPHGLLSTNYPHILSSTVPYDDEEIGLDSITRSQIELTLSGVPIELTLSGVPIDMTVPNMLNVSHATYIDDDSLTDDVFDETDSDDSSDELNEGSVDDDTEGITVHDTDIPMTSKPNSLESNWHLGDGVGQSYPAMSM